MRIQSLVAALLTSVIGLVGAAPSFAQKDTKPIELKGEAKRNAHAYKLERGATYRLTVKAEGFVPILHLADKFGPISSAFNDAGQNHASLVFSSRETMEYQLIVEFDPLARIEKGPHTYTITIEKANFAAEKDIKDPLKINAQTVKMVAGKIYAITVKALNFEPDIRIIDGAKVVAQRDNPGPMPDPFGKDKLDKRELETTLTFTPTQTKDYRLLVTVGPHSKHDAGPLNYTTTIAELKPELSLTAKITKNDPAYAPHGGSHHVHEVKLEVGKTYQIDMISKTFDTYLFLENSNKEVLVSNDDGGGDLNARIIFRPTKTDTYRVIATTFARDRIDAGEYTLTVLQNANAQPFNANPFKKDLFPPK